MALVKVRNDADDGWIEIGGQVNITQADEEPGSTFPGMLWLDTDAVGVGSGDAAAIHDNVANEITAIIPKTTPVAEDEIILEDSEASFAKKAMAMGDVPGFNVARSYCYAYMSTGMTGMSINTTHRIELDRTLFDLGSEFDDVNYWWECPEDGYYMFTCIGSYHNVNHNTTGFTFDLITSNQNYGTYWSSWQMDAQAGYWPRFMSTVTWMDEADTAYLTFYQQGGGTNLIIYQGSNATRMIVTRLA
jgi:hypothetical protein